jgi:hypothetical protein
MNCNLSGSENGFMLYKEKNAYQAISGGRFRLVAISEHRASVVVDAGGCTAHDTEFSHDVVDGLCGALLDIEEMHK